MRHLAAFGVLVAFPSLPRALAQNEITTFYGGASSVARGAAVAGDVDFDGDGWSDVVVTTPLASTGGLTENGVVHAISGRTGGVLFSSAGTASSQRFGFSVAVCGDVNADGTKDIIVGAPFALVAAGPCGLARVISGATGATLLTFNGANPGELFGFSVGGGFDGDGDGDSDLIIGAPNYTFGVTAVQIGRVVTISGGAGVLLAQTLGSTNFEHHGWSVAVVPDMNNNGVRDFVIGAPGALAQVGQVEAYDGTGSGFSLTPLWTRTGFSAAGHFGWSVAGGFDPNNDGFGDVVVGAYDESSGGLTECGAAWVLNGQTGAPLKNWKGTQADGHFGASVAVIGDVNHNGRRDVLVGAPGASYARVFDFVDNRLITVRGDAPDDGLGGCVAGAGDFNNDGETDFIVGAEYADANGFTANGYARVFSALPWFSNYCDAGTSTNGCVARMTSSGVPSVTTPNAFVITATNVEGGKSGLIFYGVSGRSNSPWGLGSSTLCVKAPTQRTVTQSSGGTAGQCDGTIGLDWYGYFGAHPTALGAPFAVGQIIDAQCWYRDPPSPKTTNLSDALEFALSP